MSSDIAIKVENLSKSYEIYDKPSDRLKQFFLPRVAEVIGKKTPKYFHDFFALENISFEIKKGETVGIVGRNGSGKSTLLQIICGTLAPTSGVVSTSGRIAALLELGSGFNPEFTGRENVYLNATILGLTQKEISERFKKIEEFADIGEFIDQPIKVYSSGMLVRLAFAVIAHVDADILIIDEALAVGDAFFTQKCMRFLRNFMKLGTVLFVSHDTGSVKSLCTHAMWIERGCLIRSGSPKKICEDYLEAFYESQQGSHTTLVANPDLLKPLPSELLVDGRMALINQSTLRNDIQLFSFEPDSPSFGAGGARIINIQFLDKNGKALSWIVGGEIVIIKIHAAVLKSIRSLIMGFTIKDRLGQGLFGDNTYLSYLDAPYSCEAGGEVTATFEFQMPRLAMGNYSISAAIADGTQLDHIQHHWMHDAVLFKSESSSIAAGLVGIPMHKIALNRI